jgi:EmrB/QacA subfamily drug resistance transporter
MPTTATLPSGPPEAAVAATPPPAEAPATAPTAPAQAPRPSTTAPLSRATWLGFLVVLIASVMDLLDSTVTQTAGPAIRHEMAGSPADLQWLTAAYTLAMSVTILLGGRLGDILGRRRVLLGGIGAFMACSLLAALAPSIELLIGARALQGVAAAVMVPQCFGLIRELFGEAGQTRAFGIFGPVMGLAAVLGPVVGGALVTADLAGTGWRAIFLINLPLGAGALALGRRALPRGAAVTPDHRFDPVSVLLAVAAGVCLIFPLIQGRQDGWPLWAALMLVGGVGLTVALGAHSARRTRRGHPTLVDPAILRRRPYLAGLAVVIGFIGAMGGMGLTLNVVLQNGLGLSPLACGAAMLPVPALAIGGSILSSLLLARIGRSTMHLGTAVMALGLGGCLAVLELAGGRLTVWELIGPEAVTGFGMGMVFVPMFDVILAGVEPHELGSASGLLESVQQLAMSSGIALVGTALFDGLGLLGGTAAASHAGAGALSVAIGLLVVAWAAVWWLPKHARAHH